MNVEKVEITFTPRPDNQYTMAWRLTDGITPRMFHGALCALLSRLGETQMQAEAQEQSRIVVPSLFVKNGEVPSA